MSRRSRGISLNEVAADLRMSSSELRRKLVETGMIRHLLADGTLPASVLHEVSEAVRRSRGGAGPNKSDSALDSLMARSGVRKLDRGHAKPLRAPKPPAESQIERARRANAELSARLKSLETQLDARSGELQELRAEVQILRKERDILMEQLSAGGARSSRPGLQVILESRGLIGEDERSAAVRALIQVRRWEELARTLAPTDPELARLVLDRNLALTCLRGDCEVPPGMAHTQVPPSRCEVCGGDGLKRNLRRLSDALLLHGLRRLALVGGSSGYRRMIREGVDPRIQVVSGSGPHAVDLSDVQLLLSWPDVPAIESEVPQVRAEGLGLVSMVRGVQAALAAGIV
jgi:hypothetical protein